MQIFLDFDGTIVEHQYPSIGKYNEGCLEVIRKLQDAKHEIILNTYRADCEDGTLEEAIAYLKASKHILPITNILSEKIEPLSWNWKRHFQEDTLFIDDICEGIPTKKTPTAPYEVVDWKKLDVEFREKGLYS